MTQHDRQIVNGSSNPSQVSKFVLVIPLLLVACTGGPTPLGTESDQPCGTHGGVLQISCPALPNTNLQQQPDYDRFAWNSFIALNWPALVDTAQLQRGIADTSRSFAFAQHDDVLVWETFRAKREVFNVPQDTGSAYPSWNSLPVYDVGGLRAGGLPSADSTTLPYSTVAPSGLVFNALDETIEVKSEALEGGASNPIYGDLVSPRVWRGDPSQGNPVLYEVKVNYDFFRYVKSRFFYVDSVASAAANDTTSQPNPGIRLPWRTTAAAGPESSTSNVNRVTGYQSSSAYETLKSANSAPDSTNRPPLGGAVHVKAAWIQLTALDDTTKYHTTTAEYYHTGPSGIERRYATFGLVGLHIIQRVHFSDTASTAKKSGGTFVFATWEHLSASSGFTYSNYRLEQGFPRSTGWYPHDSIPITTGGGFTPDTTFLGPRTYPVTRRFPILAKTDSVNQQVWSALPDSSVWRNYRLVGTQFRAVQSLPEADSLMPSYNDPDSIGQPQFLANLVIETNAGLQHFRGQPPLTNPVKNYLSTSKLSPNTFNAFTRDSRNMVSGGAGFNMGGCMGCHGVAQSEGYSFSFVLLGGFTGAGTDTQQLFDVAPAQLPNN